MYINFASKGEAYLKSLVEAGYYTNVAEAIRDTVRRMRDAIPQHDPFVQAVSKGTRSLDEGKGTPYTRELHAQILEEARKIAVTDEAIDSDFIPSIH